uniref:permease prefix domain 1-containing protein n=1 Tax=uncultured Allobacillus sp. TaxID=1638025 RepID=UPI00259747D1|nr:permease prefix domain 1-containing protein [uncultured Allobacillus sp.]
MELNKKINHYLDDAFKGVGKSQQLFDLKQELRVNMKERIKDYKDQGMDEEEAFREAKISIGDLAGLVEDMRVYGQQETKKQIYSSMTNRISTGFIVLGAMLILFGAMMTFSMIFMAVEPVAKSGTSIFAVVGSGLLVYGVLARETEKRYVMPKVRAGLYGLTTSVILFAIFVGVTSGLATKQLFVAFSSATIFMVIGIGALITLLLSGRESLRR